MQRLFRVTSPHLIKLLEREGAVMVGYRTYPDGPMQDVQVMLDEIVQEARN